jgi:hypothetical protein
MSTDEKLRKYGWVAKDGSPLTWNYWSLKAAEARKAEYAAPQEPYVRKRRSREFRPMEEAA